MPQPTNKKEMQRFLGLVNYLHRFIPNMYKEVKTLSEITHKNKEFKWNDDVQRCYDNLKYKVNNAKFIAHPDWNKEFYVVCDASGDGIGGMLAQLNDEGVLQPIEFCSKLFNNTQRNLHISEQEIYAVVYFVEKWRHILISKPFTVLTDHLNLQELFNKCKNFKAGKLYRWAVRLQDFEFTAKYIPGDDNIFADYLSRDALPTDKPPSTMNKNSDKIYYIYTLIF